MIGARHWQETEWSSDKSNANDGTNDWYIDRQRPLCLNKINSIVEEQWWYADSTAMISIKT